MKETEAKGNACELNMHIYSLNKSATNAIIVGMPIKLFMW